jgi:hypothetical protein
MENFNKKTKTTHKEAKGSGEIDMCHTAGVRMGQARHRDMGRDSTRQIRLEWRC